MGKKVYLSLGSNIGNKCNNIYKALDLIAEKTGKIISVSSFYETESWGYIDKEKYINISVEIASYYDPIELLRLLLSIEAEMGRIRKTDIYESRIIDIDIIFYENEIVYCENLSIPHPKMALRRFVLEPLNEIAPNFYHPIINKSVNELLIECIDKSNVKKIKVLPYNFICIEGNIGAGKTSLLNKLVYDLKTNALYEEFEQNTFLPKFYKNPEKYSFAVECNFLIDRYNQLRKHFKQYDGLTISDYYIQKSLIFAKSNLNIDEYKLFEKIFNSLTNDLISPKLIIFLNVNPDKLIKNICKRGREYEQGIKPSYLKKINTQYQKILIKSNIPVLYIETNNKDFVNDDVLYQKILKNIYIYINGFKKITL